MLAIALTVFSAMAAYTAAVEGAPGWWVAAFSILGLYFLVPRRTTLRRSVTIKRTP